MQIIVGLGNPGLQYQNTRHNVGFLTIDHMADKNSLSLRGKFQAQVGELTISGVKSLLVKPQTFMNLSGRSVREVLNWYKLTPEDIIVIYDDMDIPFGKIRIRSQGSPGGHNGIKSIVSELGTDGFIRIKVGIGRPPEGWNPVDYVLGNFRSEELFELDNVLNNVEDAVKEIISGGITKAMNKYNR